MTEQEARVAAAEHTGIGVRAYNGKWVFYATFNTTLFRKNRSAGRSLEKALELRRDLVATYKKSNRFYPG